MTQKFLRAVGFKNPLQGRLQRGQVIQARGQADEALGQIETYKKGVEEYEQQFNEYLKSDSGKLQYAKESGIQGQPIYGKLGRGYVTQVMAYKYSTPYGEVIDRSPEYESRQREARNTARELGFKNVAEMEEAQSFTKALGGSTFTTDKGVQIDFSRGTVKFPTQAGMDEISPSSITQNLNQNLPTFTGRPTGLQARADFNQNYQKPNEFKNLLTGFATSGVPLVSAQSDNINLNTQGFSSAYGPNLPSSISSGSTMGNTQGNIPQLQSGNFLSRITSAFSQGDKVGFQATQEPAQFRDPTTGQAVRFVPTTTIPFGSASSVPTTNLRQVSEFDYQKSLGNVPQIGGTETGFVAPTNTFQDRASQIGRTLINLPKTTFEFTTTQAKDFGDKIRDLNIQGVPTRALPTLDNLQTSFGLPRTSPSLNQIYSSGVQQYYQQSRAVPNIVPVIDRIGTSQQLGAIAELGVQAPLYATPLSAGFLATGQVQSGYERLKQPKLQYGERPEGLSNEEWNQYKLEVDNYNKLNKLSAVTDVALGSSIVLGPLASRGFRFLTSPTFRTVEEAARTSGTSKGALNVLSPVETRVGTNIIRGFEGGAIGETTQAGKRVFVSNRLRDWLGVSPIYSGKYTGDVLYRGPSFLFPQGRVIEISSQQAKKGYERAFDILLERGLTTSQATQTLRRISPQTIVSQSTYRGLVIQPEAGNLNVFFKGVREDVPMKIPEFTSTGRGREGFLSFTTGRNKVVEIGSGFEEVKSILPKDADFGALGERSLFLGASKEINPLGRLGSKSSTFREAAKATKTGEVLIPGKPTQEFFNVKSLSQETTYRRPRTTTLDMSDISVVNPEIRARRVIDFEAGTLTEFRRPSTKVGDLTVTGDDFIKVREELLPFRKVSEGGKKFTVEKKTPWESTFPKVDETPKSNLELPSPKIDTSKIVEAVSPSTQARKSLAPLTSFDTAPKMVGGRGLVESEFAFRPTGRVITNIETSEVGPLSISRPSQSKVDMKLDSKVDSKLDTLNFIGVKFDSRLLNRLDSRLDNRLKLDSKLDSKLDNRLKIDSKVNSKVSQRISTRLSTKLDTRLSPRVVSPVRVRPRTQTPRPRPPKPIGFDLPTSSRRKTKLTSKKRREEINTGSFDVYTRVKGKEVLVAPSVTKEAGLDIGASTVLRGGKKATALAASIILKPTRTPARRVQTRGEFGRVAPLFREGKVKGKGASLTLVQKDPLRLGTTQERKAIVKSRRNLL